MADIKEIEQKVIDIVAEQMGVDKAEITRDTSFINDLNADSLDKDTLENTLTVLLKHESDVQKAKRALTQGGGSRSLDSREQRRGKNRWAGGEWNN